MYHKIGQLVTMRLQVDGWEYKFRTDGRVTGVKIDGGGCVIGTFKPVSEGHTTILDLQPKERNKAMMTNTEAYGNLSYDQRVSCQYDVGDLVYLGPAYRIGGVYQADGWEGSYIVVKVQDCGHYRIARGDVVTDDHDLIIHCSRLTLR